MCFYSKQTKSATEIENRYNAHFEDTALLEPQDVINGFSHPKTPVITNEDYGIIQFLNWGLIPFWAKDKTIKKQTLNARIETIHEKPSFRNAIKNRCLIIADGFYEWKWLDEKGKQKQKYLISFPNDEVFSFAGIWSNWTDITTGEIIKSYSIVTTTANKLMAEVHNTKKRMPVMLTPENEKKWLGGEPTDSFLTCDIPLKAIEI